MFLSRKSFSICPAGGRQYINFSDIIIYIFIFLHRFKFVLCYNFLWYDVDSEANIFISLRGGDKILMLQHMEHVSRVEIVLLTNNSAVVRYTVHVLNSPGYLFCLQQNLRWVRYRSSFLEC